MTQFIDLCIMCGCDYAANIRGIGAVRALNLIKQHGSVEAAVAVSRYYCTFIAHIDGKQCGGGRGDGATHQAARQRGGGECSRAASRRGIKGVKHAADRVRPCTCWVAGAWRVLCGRCTRAGQCCRLPGRQSCASICLVCVLCLTICALHTAACKALQPAPPPPPLTV